MRTCHRCGQEMEEGYFLTVDVSTFSSSFEGGAAIGGGSGQVALARHLEKPKGLFRVRTEAVGDIHAALCPECGEVSLYTST